MKGCLSVGLILAVIFAMLGLGAYKLFQHFTDAVDDFPEYAKKDTVYKRHGELIAEIEAIISGSQSMYDLAARLEKMTLPDEIVYLTLIKITEDSFTDNKIDVVKTLEITSRSQTIIDGTGFGKLNGIPVTVIRLPVNRHSIEDCFIYIRTKQDATS